jgi:hypothetical protein
VTIERAALVRRGQTINAPALGRGIRPDASWLRQFSFMSTPPRTMLEVNFTLSMSI